MFAWHCNWNISRFIIFAPDMFIYDILNISPYEMLIYYKFKD